MQWVTKVLCVVCAWSVGAIAIDLFTRAAHLLVPSTRGTNGWVFIVLMYGTYLLAGVATLAVLRAWLWPKPARRR